MMPATSLLFVLTALLTSVPSTADPLPGAPGPQVDPGPAPAVLAPVWDADLVRLGAIEGLAPVGPHLLVLDRGNGVTALDLRDGRSRWFLQLDEPPLGRPFEGAGLIAAAVGTEMLVVEADTGRRVFQEAVSDVPAGSPVSDGRWLFTPSYRGNRFVVRNLTTGLVEWSLGLPDILLGPAQLSDVGLVIYACRDGTVRSVHTSDSVERGEAWFARTGTIVGRPVLDGDRVLVSSLDPAVYALDGTSGTVVWKHLPGQPPVGIPVVGGGFVVAATDTRLFALSADTGRETWSVDARELPIGIVGDVLVTRSPDGSTVLRDLTRGEVRATGLSSLLYPCGDVIVERAGPTRLRAWRVR